MRIVRFGWSFPPSRPLAPSPVAIRCQAMDRGEQRAQSEEKTVNSRFDAWLFSTPALATPGFTPGEPLTGSYPRTPRSFLSPLLLRAGEGAGG